MCQGRRYKRSSISLRRNSQQRSPAKTCERCRCDVAAPLNAQSGRTKYIFADWRGKQLRRLSPTSQRRSRINKPAAIASTASTVFTVVETRTFSNGKSPVRINQTASKIIPRFLPASVLVIAIDFLLSNFHQGSGLKANHA